MLHRIALVSVLLGEMLVASQCAAEAPAWTDVGSAKVDITPDYPVRLNGYGSRRTESQGVEQRLWVKALAIGDDDSGPAILLTVDNCAVPAAVTEAACRRIGEASGVPRRRIVVCSTHTHTAPLLSGAIPFILSVAPSPDQQARIDQYTKDVTAALVKAASDALANRREARLSWTVGKVDFAVNRRSLRDGRWVGFGEQTDGPVDHSLPVLVARDRQDGVVALLVGYACHCTTLGGDFNKLCGDWAGYAQEYLEQDHPGAVAMVNIGCGADANPRPRGELKHCKQQGRQIAEEVKRLLEGEMRPVDPKLSCKLLKIQLPLAAAPEREHWEKLAEREDQIVRHAQHFLEMLDRGEKIPDSVAYPVGSWTFGDDLAMVFLGGEVVVDYAIRMKTEFDDSRLWITAYANDVPCYIPSRRILAEGGYEADRSMIYYGMPSRLDGATEDLIVDTAQKLLPASFYSKKKQQDFPPAQSPEEGRQSIQVPKGFTVELVAAEPLIADPVAFDWGPDGRLWVVEMRDYPSGMDGKGKPGGRVKMLEDVDGDGRYDRSELFLDNLPFPTGVKVWRNGVLITAAPDILYAEDTDGDGKADVTKTLYRGFGEGNQQHRVNGLRWGLDNWLYIGNGDSDGTIESQLTGEVVNVGGRDLRIRPDEGLLEVQSGRTQFGRERDDWGNWFGGNNSNPMWHYVLKDHYLRRNRFLSPPSVRKDVPSQPGAAPVYPVSRTLARFNDFNKADRFTSACSPIIYRDTLLGEEFYGNSFVCEPVHNLVHREVVSPQGVSFTSRRAKGEAQSEFFASSDNWCRPSMVRTGPDGALWISDMYRFVIEHPKWIPDQWMRKLNERAGDDRGRIYRVYATHTPPRRTPRLNDLTAEELVKQLESPNGHVRDMAHQLLVWSGDKAAVSSIAKLAREGKRATARLHALCVLDGLKALTAEAVKTAMKDEHAGVRRHAARLSESLVNHDPSVAEALAELATDSDKMVRLQTAYSLGEWKDAAAGEPLAAIAAGAEDDVYLLAAAASSLNEANLASTVDAALAGGGEGLSKRMLGQLLAQGKAFKDSQVVNRLFSASWPREKAEIASDETFTTMAGLLKSLGDGAVLNKDNRQRVNQSLVAAMTVASDDSGSIDAKVSAANLLSHALDRRPEIARSLATLLSPRTPSALQAAAVSAIGELGAKEAPDLLLDGWTSHTPTVRSLILDALLTRTDWTKRLLATIKSSHVSASRVEARRRSQLLAHKDDEVRRLAKELLSGSTNADRQAVVRQYREALRLGPNVASGKAVFKEKCAACHRLESVGHPVGPDLTALTNKTAEAMLIALMDPNRAVEDKYLEFIVVTVDGRQFSGMIAEESGASLTLASPDGKRHAILRDAIEEMRATGKSLMPEGLEKDLSPQQVADVISYVASAAPPAKQFEGNEPKVVQVSINGRLSLLATDCRIYGPSLVYEPHYRNLGYWQSPLDRAVWTMEAPTSGEYRVTLDYACPDAASGDAYLVEVAGQTLSGRVASTGGWDHYRSTTVGRVRLEAGPVELQVRSAGPIRSALFDLRAVRLTP